jgi:hypothetical protein
LPAAGQLPVRCCAADHLIVKKEKVLHRHCYRIEHGLALSRSQPDFENAIPAPERDRLLKLWSNRRIRSFLGSLAQGNRTEARNDRQNREGTDCEQAEHAIGVGCAVE